MDCSKAKKIMMENAGSAKDILREHLAECSSCRKMFYSLNLLENGRVLYEDTPCDLENRCMDKIMQQKYSNHEFAAGSKGIWVNVKYLAAAAVLLIILSVSVTLSVISLNPDGRAVVYLSLYAPEAENVSVVGDWNDWVPGRDMLNDRNMDGTWEIKLEVEPGREYRYQFLVNGSIRLSDPSSRLTVDDGFGGENSILDI